jgi:hypothetical protein
MLTAGVTIATVVAMIGGIQYVLGAGSGDVKKGKERIKNAIVGLILLAAVHLILLTVNPALIKLQVPKLPMLKSIDLVQSSSCEDLELSEYVIKDKDNNDMVASQKKCGTLAKVVSDKKGSPVAEGTTCQFNTCPSSLETCIGSGSKAKCLSCEYVVDRNLNGFFSVKTFPSLPDITPNKSICVQLSHSDPKATLKKLPPHIYQCGWTRDADLNPGIFKTGASGSCALVDINCSQITSCKQYDSLKAKNLWEEDGESLTGVTEEDGALCSIEGALSSGGCGNFGIVSICKKNPCGLTGGCKVLDNHCLSNN